MNLVYFLLGSFGNVKICTSLSRACLEECATSQLRVPFERSCGARAAVYVR